MNKVTFIPEGHKYIDGNGNEVPSVSRILEWFKITDIDKVRRIHGDEYIDHCSAAGTEIHRICTLDDQGKLKRGDWNPEFTPWLNAWRKYRDEYKPNFLAIEQPLVSMVWGFAGQPDRVEDCGKWLDVIDIKSGVKMKAHEYQTAMYQILIEENYKMKVRQRTCVYLKEDDYKQDRFKNQGIINDVKCLLRTYQLQKQMGVFDGK